ncbi:MAG TPA: alpha/beta fold hydrolase [Usitatibacter sp.]|nr:alpha/beta fold hydrolase [Usitatibacter sp.]
MAAVLRSSSLNSTNVRNALGFAWQRLSLSLASAFAPEKAVERAVRLFGTPPRIAHTPRENEFLHTGVRYQVAAPHGALAAWRFGGADRPAVVLVHGWGGRGAQLRAFTAPLLEAGYQVVLYDHVGHGHSDGERASLIHFVSDLEAVVRDVESKGAVLAGLVGHSLGAAAIAAWLNETRRDVRAVLVAPPTSVERYSNFFARRVGISEAVRREMQRRFEVTLGRRWSEFELPQSVANVRAQALVIHDTGDRDVGHASGLALARAWPGARLLSTRGLGHRRILRDPDVVRDAADFIAGRVVFAPPPAPGAAAFGAPAPIL